MDSSGNIYVVGSTSSSDFPAVNAIDSSHNGGTYDCFIAKIRPDGKELLFSTFFGGSGYDRGECVLVDDSGQITVAGTTSSSDFPTTPGAFDTTYNGGRDVFVVKFDASGQTLLYSTYFGASGDDYVHSMDFDNLNRVCLTGHTSSTNLPTSTSAFSEDYNGGIYDCFITKISADGSSLVFSTYLGGSDVDGWYPSGYSTILSYTSIALDLNDYIYITGYTESSNFPIESAYDFSFGGDADCFVTKIDPSGQSIIYSTYVGTSGIDFGTDISVDEFGCAYVAGQTTSSSFPTCSAYDATYNGGGSDAFVLKLNADGSDLAFSTFLGGAGVDPAFSIEVEPAGSAYVAGFTDSGGFPTRNAFLSSYQGGGSECFVSKFNCTSGELLYSTFVGAGGIDPSTSLAIDQNGTAYVTGWTTSAQFPTVDAYDDTYSGGNHEDAFVFKLPDYGDSDLDNLSDWQEVTLGLDRFSKDSDGDVMWDSWELEYSLDPLNGSDASLDADSDTLTNLEEFMLGLNPRSGDSDGDLMPDPWEVQNGLDAAVDDAQRDLDGDSLSNYQEYLHQTDPQDPDSDLDSIGDGWEVSFG
ncbi:MAG: hypothetical protein DRP08_01435, partial [Candidatus Aenigmatarchaeota archaeon]